jgi:predicted neutral ceramidase superfamily lipid hydrolase
MAEITEEPVSLVKASSTESTSISIDRFILPETVILKNSNAGVLTGVLFIMCSYIFFIIKSNKKTKKSMIMSKLNANSFTMSFMIPA